MMNESDRRNAFFQMMESRTQFLSRAAFSHVVQNPFQKGAVLRSSKSIFGNDLTFSVFLCTDDFVIGDSDYSDVIPVVLRHEYVEAWLYMNLGRQIGIEGSRDLIDQLAREEQFRYAFQINKAERCLELSQLWLASVPEPYQSQARGKIKGVYDRMQSEINKPG